MCPVMLTRPDINFFFFLPCCFKSYISFNLWFNDVSQILIIIFFWYYWWLIPFSNNNHNVFFYIISYLLNFICNIIEITPRKSMELTPRVSGLTPHPYCIKCPASRPCLLNTSHNMIFFLKTHNKVENPSKLFPKPGVTSTNL